MTEPQPRRTIAYLAEAFDHPANAHIRREAEAMKDAGATVVAISLEGGGDATTRAGRGSSHAIPHAALLDGISAHLQLLARDARGWADGMRAALTDRPPGLRGLWRRLRLTPRAAVASARLRKAGAAHLHIRGAGSAADVGMIAAAFARLPFSLSIDGPDVFFAATAERLDAKISRAVFAACASHFVRGQCMIWAKPEDWDKLHVVHSGADLSHPLAERRAGASPTIVAVTPITDRSGVFDLASAFAETRAAVPSAKLAIVGDGPARAPLARRISELKLAEAAELTGWLDDEALLARLDTADLFVSAGGGASQPAAAKQAMARGLPVIAARAPGVFELITPGKEGVVTPAARPADLAKAMTKILEDRETRARMGVAARDRIADGHDAAAEAATVTALILSAGRRSPDVAAGDPAIPPGRGGSDSRAATATR